MANLRYLQNGLPPSVLDPDNEEDGIDDPAQAGIDYVDAVQAREIIRRNRERNATPPPPPHEQAAMYELAGARPGSGRYYGDSQDEVTPGYLEDAGAPPLPPGDTRPEFYASNPDADMAQGSAAADAPELSDEQMGQIHARNQASQAGATDGDFWSGIANPAYKGSQLNPNPGSKTPALDRLAEMQGERPLLKRPKWYMSLAAGALGGAEGWANNDGRAHPQFDIEKDTDNVAHPGYMGRLAEWRSRMIPAQMAADTEAAKKAIADKDQDRADKHGLNAAQIRYQDAHAQYMLGEGRRANPWAFNSKTGQYYNKATGETQAAPQTLQQRFDDFMSVKGQDGKPVYTAEQAKILANGGKLTEPKADTNMSEMETYLAAAGGDPKKALALKLDHDVQRARESRDPDLKAATIASIASSNADRTDREQDRHDKAEDKDRQDRTTVLSTKVADENKIHQERLQSLATAHQNGASAEQIAAINNKAVNALQSVQNRYATEWRARKLQTEDQDVYLDANNDIRYRQRPPAGHGPWAGRGNFPASVPPPKQTQQAAPPAAKPQAAPARPQAALATPPAALKVYADKFFGGDTAKAQAAIDAQRAAKAAR